MSQPAGDPGTAGLTGQWCFPFPVRPALALGVHRRGRGDPAFRIDESGAIWRTCLTPHGPATLRLVSVDAPVQVLARAWGPGASWLLAAVPDLLGAHDEPAAFQPSHPFLRDALRRYGTAAVRVGRSSRVLEALVPAVLEQKVVAAEARRAWRLLLLKFGTPAPGPAPAGMRVFPPPRVWARIPSWEWHRAGVEGVRARTIIGAATVAARLEGMLALGPSEADQRLRSLTGIGPWTSAETRQRAWGDPDAVSVGDYHLPAAVGWALAGQVADDAGMLALLAPYAGHRHRAARLVELGGGRPPRRGPRMAVRDYRAF